MTVGDEARVARLGVCGLVESDGQRDGWRRPRAAGQRHQRCGIDPAAQEHPEGRIADEMEPRGVVEQGTRRDGGVIDRRLRQGRPGPQVGGQLPVRARPEGARVDHDRVSGRNGYDILDRGPRKRDRAELQEPDQRIRVALVGNQAAAQESADFGGEDHSLAIPVVVEGLDPQAVAGKEEARGRPGLEHGKGEHAAETREDVLSPGLVASEDDLGVGLRGEGVAAAELPLELAVVVGFPVVGDPEATVAAPHRHTPTRREVEDGQTASREDGAGGRRRSRVDAHILAAARPDNSLDLVVARDRLGDQEPPIVRAPMDLGLHHAEDGERILGRRTPGQLEEPRNSAHGLSPHCRESRAALALGQQSRCDSSV